MLILKQDFFCSNLEKKAHLTFSRAKGSPYNRPFATSSSIILLIFLFSFKYFDHNSKPNRYIRKESPCIDEIRYYDFQNNISFNKFFILITNDNDDKAKIEKR